MRPTKAHYLKVTAAEESAADGPIENLKGYELMLSTLAMHKRRLKQIESRQRKAEYKRKSALPDFLPWLEGVLEAGTGRQDNVFMYCLIWAIDCEDYALAVRLARYAVLHDLVLPDNFSRSLGAMLAEEFAENAHNAQLNNQSFDVEYLEQIDELTVDLDMPDEVRAKLYKQIGLLKAENAPEIALDYFRQALSLHSKSGVKDAIKKLEKRLEKAE